MRLAPICPLPEYFVSYEDSKGRYVEVQFEKKNDAELYIKRLLGRKVPAELWTRSRVFPKVRSKPRNSPGF